MNINLMVGTMKKSLSLLLAVCLLMSPAHIALAAVGAFEEVQILKGDVYTIAAKGLQRVSVTDPAVADITDAQPGQVVVVGQQAGQTVLFLWDESGKRSFIIRVITDDLGLVKARIQTLLDASLVTGVKVEQNDLEGKVMLTGVVPEDKMANVNSVADSFPGSVLNLVKKEDIEDMIQLDMQITELSSSLSKLLGVKWNDSLSVSETLPTATGKVKDLFTIGDFNRTTALLAAINALITEGKGHVLSKPRLVVKSGKEATFLVGGEIPISTTTSSVSSQTTQTSVSFKSYGISMGATPSIKKGKVDLLLNVEISGIDEGRTGANGDVAFTTRTAQTQLFLDDKQTIVLAGLIDKRDSQTVNRVPLMSKIPLVGALFRNTKTPTSETEVVISITPTIIKALVKEEEIKIEPVVKNDNLPVVKPDDQITMAAGRNDVKLPVIAKNAAEVPVTIAPELKPYAEAVQQKVSASIAYPYEAQENRWQGTVKLALVIRKDGSLRDVFVKESSGYDVFDQDAVNTAQILAPYSAFPAGLAQDEITVTLPIVYSLDAFLKNVAKRK
ncbi:MAG: TonB family protein [Candidatus Omnitrophica bacterium]|nr:TonB family protein [Candidatus Omnitrophota bacterium]